MLPRRKVILVVGRTGSGKTLLARDLITRADRVIVLDPNHEYSGAVVYNMGEFLDFFRDQNPARFQIACRFDNDTDEELLFEAIFQIGNVLFVVEEMDTFVDPQRKLPAFGRLIKRGRHKTVHLLGIAQRTPQFSATLRAQQTSFVSFRVTEPLDIDRLSQYGFDKNGLENLAEFKWSARSRLPIEGKHFKTVGESVDAIRF